MPDFSSIQSEKKKVNQLQLNEMSYIDENKRLTNFIKYITQIKFDYMKTDWSSHSSDLVTHLISLFLHVFMTVGKMSSARVWDRIEGGN